MLSRSVLGERVCWPGETTPRRPGKLPSSSSWRGACRLQCRRLRLAAVTASRAAHLSLRARPGRCRAWCRVPAAARRVGPAAAERRGRGRGARALGAAVGSNICGSDRAWAAVGSATPSSRSGGARRCSVADFLVPPELVAGRTSLHAPGDETACRGDRASVCHGRWQLRVERVSLSTPANTTVR